MGRNSNNHPLLRQVRIESVAAEGKALARVDDMVVFVSGVVPGDVVDIQVQKKSKNFREGIPVFFHEHSPLKVPAFCEHFGVCGGCKWQNLPYASQLEFKQQQVVDQLTRIGKVELGLIEPILPSPETTYYRNKLEFSFSNRRWLTRDEVDSHRPYEDMDGLGFHVPKMFDRIVDVRHCHLQPEPSNSIRNACRAYAKEHQLSFYDAREHSGFLRNMIVRTTTTGQAMVVLSFGQDRPEARAALLDHLAAQFPQVTSWMYVVNTKRNDSMGDQQVLPYAGADHIVEQMDDLRFKIGPKSFYQTNPRQAHELYKIAREFADLKGREVVYDLYTGTGTIANFVARSAAKVVGIEYVEEAILDARHNAELNGITNASFFAGDMKDVLSAEFIAREGRPDVVITDPPRAGMHPDVLKALLAAAPERVVYVSCNPATQARDILGLSERYRVERTRPVDMFPHTHHVENVALLRRIDPA